MPWLAGLVDDITTTDIVAAILFLKGCWCWLTSGVSLQAISLTRGKCFRLLLQLRASHRVRAYVHAASKHGNAKLTHSTPTSVSSGLKRCRTQAGERGVGGSKQAEHLDLEKHRGRLVRDAATRLPRSSPIDRWRCSRFARDAGASWERGRRGWAEADAWLMYASP